MTNASEIIVRELKVEDLFEVAEIHKKAFPDSALTKLGLEPVRRYYKWQLLVPHDCFAVGVFDKDTLVGYCFAGVFRGSLSGFLKKNKKFLVFWIIAHPWLIANSLVINRIKKAFRIFNYKSTNKMATTKVVKKSFGVLSIAVDPAKQNLGIGKIIMASVEEEVLRKNFSQLHLTVHPTNLGAIAFYDRCGWIKSPSENGIWEGFMTKQMVLNRNE